MLFRKKGRRRAQSNVCFICRKNKPVKGASICLTCYRNTVGEGAK